MRIAIIIVACAACSAAEGDRDPSTTVAATDDASSSPATSTNASTTSDTATTIDDTTASADTTAASDATADTTTGPSGPPSIARIGDTFVIPTLPATAPKRFADVAHDPAADVYLQVNGNVATSGTFLAGDATILGEPFAIADTTAYTQGVHVAHGGEAFLVAWHDNREGPDTARLRGRRVRWDGAAQLGADVEIGTGDTYSEMPPAIAWSQTSGTFLVAWHTAAGDDIHAQRVDAEGTRVGDPIVVTADADWQSDAGLAWNSERDEWLLVYTHAGATTEVRARMIAADGTLLGNELTLASAAGTWLAQAAFDPNTGDYLVAWFEGRIAAVTLDQDGAPTREIFELATGYGSYDGFALAHDPGTGWFGAAFHGTSDEDFAIAFDIAGMQSEVIEATSSRGDDGNFNPRIAARGDGEWLLVTSRGFADVVGQRLGP